MSISIALAGNPNCGKTTLFNALTGSNQFVGNWPGVTVEKKEGKLKGHSDVIITDLPGIYSLSPYTVEEVVARNYLVNERPDAILNLVDGTNLERNLYLTTQLVELGIPVVVAINMIDIVNKSGNKINIDILSKHLGCEVVEISALKGTGIMEAAQKAIESAHGKKRVPFHRFSGAVEHAIAHIEEACIHDMPQEQQRWYAIKIFELDDRVLEQLNIPQNVLEHIKFDIATAEEELDDEAQSIIVNERYNYIEDILEKSYERKGDEKLSVSDKIDKIVTNKYLALPIFAVVMFLVYYVSVTTVGTIVTDWTNDVLFGTIIPPAIESLLVSIGCADWLQGLVLDGIVGGVGAVLGFVPQMFVLFFFLAFLEGCGYMARIAFIMDKIFCRFGLSGKSFIPMLIGTGCGVPGIMASRTIENERDRRMTIMTTTFIPCGAKLPIIALISGALFGNAPWVAPSAYFVGIGAVIISGLILKKTKLFAGDPAPFVMELPAYHMPPLGNVLRSMWERGWSFIKKACTIILLSSVILWFMQNFGFENGAFAMVADLNNSVLARFGNLIDWLFAPLGWGDWKAAVATITGLIAKENVIGTFGVLYQYAGELSENGDEIFSIFAQQFNAASGYSFLVFNLLCAPCFAAMGAIKREMNNWKWTLFALGYQTVFAWIMAFIVYQIGSLFVGGANAVGVVIACVFVVILIALIAKPYKQSTTLKTKVK